MLGWLAGALAAPALRVARAWRLTRQTAARVPEVADAVLILPRLSDQLERVAVQTASLLDMHAEIARVRGDTATLHAIQETLARMEGRLDRIDVNTTAVEQLAEIALPLQGAALRVGRVADRFPARRPPPRP